MKGLGRAGRDLEGIRKCLLHAVYQAQGQGCSAGVIGVGIGETAHQVTISKNQLFRTLDDINPVPELKQLEEYVLENAK